MTPRTFCLLVLWLCACTSPPGPTPTATAPAATAPAVTPPPPDPWVYAAPPATRERFSGQATHLGKGLYCAFYAIGFSADGRFAWVDERRINDMALAYSAQWTVSDSQGQQVGNLSFTADEGQDPGGITLAATWEQHREQVDALLRTHGIVPGSAGPLQALPLGVPAGTLDAHWDLAPMDALQQRATLTVDGPAQGQQRVVADLNITTMPTPAPAVWAISSSDGAHTILLAEVVEDEPVEALVSVRYLVISTDGA